ncbi:MAG TPA: carbon storage regulator [Pirellulales bacterium]|jgi:carbon storage regulator CsrA
MLVLTRKAQEQIRIGDDVVVTILRVKGQSVRVGIQAPRNIRVLRSELPKDDSLTIEPTLGASAALSEDEFEDACEPTQPSIKPAAIRPAPRVRMGLLDQFPKGARLLDDASSQAIYFRVRRTAGPKR